LLCQLLCQSTFTATAPPINSNNNFFHYYTKMSEFY
jgi:hypothetical protein